MILGIDPSLSNIGLVITDDKLSVYEATTISIPATKHRTKGISDTYRMAAILDEYFKWLSKDITEVFGEAPIGSQSSRAMVSYSFSCALLAIPIRMGIPTTLVTPMDIKKRLGLYEKQDIVQWVEDHYPGWLPRKNGKIVLSKASHQADAFLTILTGKSL